MSHRQKITYFHNKNRHVLQCFSFMAIKYICRNRPTIRWQKKQEKENFRFFIGSDTFMPLKILLKKTCNGLKNLLYFISINIEGVLLASSNDINSTEKLLNTIRGKDKQSFAPIEKTPLSLPPRQPAKKINFSPSGFLTDKKRYTVGVDISEEFIGMVKAVHSLDGTMKLVDQRIVKYPSSVARIQTTPADTAEVFLRFRGGLQYLDDRDVQRGECQSDQGSQGVDEATGGRDLLEIKERKSL